MPLDSGNPRHSSTPLDLERILPKQSFLLIESDVPQSLLLHYARRRLFGNAISPLAARNIEISFAFKQCNEGVSFVFVAHDGGIRAVA